MKKVTQLFIGLVLAVTLAMPIVASAQSTLTNTIMPSDVRNEFNSIGFTNSISPQSTAVSVINILLSFLGIIAVILILWAGFLWMTAGGNEDNVSKAKKIMISAVIGLLIILAAYGIVNWVLDTLTEVV